MSGKAWNNTPDKTRRTPTRQAPQEPRCPCSGPFPLYRNSVAGHPVKTCASCDYGLRHGVEPAWVPVWSEQQLQEASGA